VDVTETLIDQPGETPGVGRPDSGVAPPRRGPTPGVAAILSFILPGLGQALNGAVRRGLLIAVPTLVVVVVIVAALAGGARGVLTELIQPPVLLAVIVANGLFAVYHLLAIGDAFRVARRRGPKPASPGRSATLLVVALVATLGLHGLVGGIGLQAYSTVSAIVPSPGSGLTIPIPSFGLGTPSPTDASAEPTVTPGPAWAADGRLNLLLIGGDSGPKRLLLRTDTMILLSVDVATGRAALFGIPRNLNNAPLAPEDAKAFPKLRFPPFLNALYVYAYTHPKTFPAGGCTPDLSDACRSARGFRAITGSIQQLTGVPLDGAIVVNLNGFVDLVDAVGGLWLRTERVYDTRYPLESGNGYVTLNITAGCHHLDGHLALAYARSRHQDSDYGRMGRQQQVLVAMLHQLDPLELLPKVPELLDIAKDNLTLAIPAADIGSLASLAASVDPDAITRVEFSPPKYLEVLTTKEIGRIQKVVRTVFDTPLASPGPTASVKPVATLKTCGPS
jgi:LCP family protein required for cell wall assembly